MIPLAGEIEDLALPWLFQDLRTGKKTGTVVFTRDTETKKVYFKDGDILFASSNLEEDRLGEFLLRTGKITKAQFDSSSAVVIKTGKKLGAVLFEAGVLTSHDLVAHVKLQVKEIILKVFGWHDGHYQFDSGPLPIAEIIPLHISTGDLIIEGVSSLDWKVIRKSLPPITSIIRPASDPSLLFQNAHLGQDQREVFSLIDGNRSIQELCGLSGIGDYNTLKAIHLLLALRMAEQGEIRTEDDKKFVRDVVRETIEPQEKLAQEPAAAAVDVKKMIQSAYDGLAGKNYYEALGMARNASPQEIKKAYFHYAKLYHPDRHFDPEMNDMKEKLETLFARIHDAYETLSSQPKRDKYDIELYQEERRPGTTGPAQSEKPNNKEIAATQFNEGKKHYQVQNFWGAEESFRWAMRLEPENAEYIFYLGLALSRIPRRGHEAEEYFVKAVELSPSRAEYFLELGNFYMKNGLKTKALSMFQKALTCDPSSDKIKSFIKSAGGQP
jgi:tetratricopeptide (TPR) repeat protein